MSVQRTHYPEEIKAAAFAALLEGQAITAVANKYSIPRGTVSRWAGEVRGEGYHAAQAAIVESKRERIGELIIDNLEAMLEVTREMVHVFTDKEWLCKYSPSEVAVLYGVLSDKTYRLLEAIPDTSSDESDEGTELQGVYPDDRSQVQILPAHREAD